MRLLLQKALLIGVIFFLENDLASGSNVALQERNKSEDEPFRFMDRVKFHGYIAEKHLVKSDDGYILVLHRISGGPNNPPAAGKKVVYVQHGLLMSTDQFIANGPGIDFVYLLVDAGYDVWLGNCRGNVYSKNHESLLAADKEFWDFSYHEAAIYDVKAFIDYTLKVTKQERLVFIGFSLGTTYGYVLLSHLPEYNDKVALLISLGTVAYWHHNKDVRVQLFGVLTTYFEKLNGVLKIYEFSPPTQKYLGPLATSLCGSDNFFVKILCRVLFVVIAPNMKFDRAQEGSFGRLLHSFPAGTSTKTLFHLAQNVISGDFTEYDYGKLNEEKYGSKLPPEYPLEKVTAPVAIYYGLNDLFADTEDIMDLQKSLPNVILCQEINDKYFGHADIALNQNAREVLFDDFIQLISEVHW